MRLGLQARFLGLVALLVVGFGAVVTALAVQVQADRLRHQLEERARLMASLAAANAGDALALLDVRQLRGLLADLRNQGEVVDAVVFDDEWRILTDGTLTNPRRHHPVPRPRRVAPRGPEAAQVEHGDDTLTVIRPIFLGGRLLGGVRLTLSTASLEEERALLTTRTLLVALAFILVGLVVSAVTVRRITQPLSQVIAATQVVARGEDAPRIPVSSSDEMGELVEAFNRMTERLRTTTVSRDYLNQVLGSMGESLLVLTPDGTISRVNRATCAMLGYDEADLVGRPFAAVLTPHGVSGASSALLDALDSRSWSHGLETELYGSDGAPIPVIASLTVMSRGQSELGGFVCVARDIRERKRVEQMKDEFVSVVNHELRTPLASIRGALGLLKGGAVGALPARAGELLEVADRNGERLERLINDLLDSQRLEAGRLDFHIQDHSLARLVEQAVEANSAFGLQHGVGFVIENEVGEASVRVDGDRFIQVMTNLLSNAVRFSPQGESVTITLTRRDRWLRVAVSDRGPGIPEAYRGRVFQKFAQAHRPGEGRTGGTGLGLSISKAIVEQLGGTIAFATRTDEGTTFFVDLPQARPRSPSGSYRTAGEGDRRPDPE